MPENGSVRETLEFRHYAPQRSFVAMELHGLKHHA
jgi:hypothetical protein